MKKQETKQSKLSATQSVKLVDKITTKKVDKKVVKEATKQTTNTINKQLVVKMFKEGKTPYQIAKELGKYYSQIAPILEREGLTWKKRSTEPTGKKSHTIYCSDETFVKVQELIKKLDK